MNTLTTKQLRENMPKVIDDLKKGKQIKLSYRHKIIGVLQPIMPAHKTLRRGSLEAIRQGLANLQDVYVPDHTRNDPRTIKERITELRDRKFNR